MCWNCQHDRQKYLKQTISRQKYGPCCTPHIEQSESSRYGSTCSFFVNLAVLISMNADTTAFMYERELLKVTRADPSGYLYLSVSIPTYTTPSNRSFIIFAKPSAVSCPCSAPTNTVFVGSSFCEVDLTKLESAIFHGITSTSLDLMRFEDILKLIRAPGGGRGLF